MKCELYVVGRTYIYLIGTDHTAGLKNRYTVWRILQVGSKTSEVIGRELPLRIARGVVKRYLVEKHLREPAPAVKPMGSMARGRHL